MGPSMKATGMKGKCMAKVLSLGRMDRAIKGSTSMAGNTELALLYSLQRSTTRESGSMADNMEKEASTMLLVKFSKRAPGKRGSSPRKYSDQHNLISNSGCNL